MSATEIALEPPRAYPATGVRGALRRVPADFQVEELPGAPLAGRGEHLYLNVEKTGHNTAYVAGRLASAFGVPERDVSYAGRKDRHAVTRQWFSIRRPAHAEAVLDEPGMVELERCWHTRKLRRGELAGNRFRIRLRDVTDPAAAETRLTLLAEAPVPNYFGRQRFGRGGANIDRARRWLARDRRRRGPPGLNLSVGRALLFNRVLAARVRRGDWNLAIAGDVSEDAGPTGPLWGRGRSNAAGDAARIERDALAGLGDWREPLEHCGLVQERRPLAMRAVELSWCAPRPGALELAFTLGPGCFATAWLRELGDLEETCG